MTTEKEDREKMNSTERLLNLLKHSRLEISGIVLTLFSMIHVLVDMTSRGVYGFSFDDSWIHVQYARTIFEGRPWEYSAGIPSTGSSGPLWSVVLSPIFLFGYERDTIVTSVLFISAVFYIACTILVGHLVKERTNLTSIAIAAQAVFVLVPRNTGLMLSGMETPLGMFIILLILLFLTREDKRYDPILGILAGLAYLCRPEFVLVAALCFPVRSVVMLYKDRLSPKRLLSLLSMFGLAVLVVLPWILHCLNTTGLPLPDSYYSKMRWGVSQTDIDYWNFFWYQAWLPSEPYLILGLLGGIILALRQRPYEFILAGSLFALYRITMPGMSLLFAARYLVPLFDLLAISFTAGLGILFDKMFSNELYSVKMTSMEKQVIPVVLVFLLFSPSIVSYVEHVDIHTRQAANIHDMQETLSLWARNNLPDNATIATYDVGAIGYFFHGPVIDLYGLVTPVILHNYTSLYSHLTFLQSIGCRYIMFYEEWFQIGYARALASIDANWTILYSTHLDDNVVCGTDNMAIYRIDW
jgi:hypothetical protein